MAVIFPIEKQSQKEVLGVALTFSILAFVAVCLRLFSHHLAHKSWVASDYFIIAACIFAIALQSISITGVVQAGIGYGHVVQIIETFGPEPITKLLQLIIPLQVLWVLSLSCTKISILLLYLSIFPVKLVIRISWATITVIVGWTIATILAGFLICRPFAYNWDQTIPGGSCGNQVTSFTATGVINLVTDVIVLITPMPLLYKLHMPAYKRFTLMAVFGLGIVTCVISALRISVLSTMNFADITFSIPLANIFSGIEPCVAVTLASIPMMRPLLGRQADSRQPTIPSAPSANSKARGDDGFRQLGDDTSQLWLRPMGSKHQTDVAVQDMNRRSEDSSIDTGDSARAGQGPGQGQGPGIAVRQEWGVLRQ